MSTTQFPTKNAVPRQWHVIDAEGKVLGKVASLAASMLMGKHKTNYTPFIDAGDHVIVINAQKIVLTGKKEGQKVYRHFTGYPGGLVERTLQRVRSIRPSTNGGRRYFRYAPQVKNGQADVPQVECLRWR